MGIQTTLTFITNRREFNPAWRKRLLSVVRGDASAMRRTSSTDTDIITVSTTTTSHPDHTTLMLHGVVIEVPRAIKLYTISRIDHRRPMIVMTEDIMTQLWRREQCATPLALYNSMIPAILSHAATVPLDQLTCFYILVDKVSLPNNSKKRDRSHILPYPRGTTMTNRGMSVPGTTRYEPVDVRRVLCHTRLARVLFRFFAVYLSIDPRTSRIPLAFDYDDGLFYMHRGVVRMSPCRSFAVREADLRLVLLLLQYRHTHACIMWSIDSDELAMGASYALDFAHAFYWATEYADPNTSIEKSERDYHQWVLTKDVPTASTTAATRAARRKASVALACDDSDAGCHNGTSEVPMEQHIGRARIIQYLLDPDEMRDPLLVHSDSNSGCVGKKRSYMADCSSSSSSSSSSSGGSGGSGGSSGASVSRPPIRYRNVRRKHNAFPTIDSLVTQAPSTEWCTDTAMLIVAPRDQTIDTDPPCNPPHMFNTRETDALRETLMVDTDSDGGSVDKKHSAMNDCSTDNSNNSSSASVSRPPIRYRNVRRKHIAFPTIDSLAAQAPSTEWCTDTTMLIVAPCDNTAPATSHRTDASSVVEYHTPIATSSSSMSSLSSSDADDIAPLVCRLTPPVDAAPPCYPPRMFNMREFQNCLRGVMSTEAFVYFALINGSDWIPHAQLFAKITTAHVQASVAFVIDTEERNPVSSLIAFTYLIQVAWSKHVGSACVVPMDELRAHPKARDFPSAKTRAEAFHTAAERYAYWCSLQNNVVIGRRDKLLWNSICRRVTNSERVPLEDSAIRVPSTLPDGIVRLYEPVDVDNSLQ